MGEGHEVTKDELAKIMLSLERQGCHNINFVSPTHVIPQILEALEIAVAAGLTVPLVYNSGGYDSVDTLEILDGIVDIYMPDMKYSDEETARRFSGIDNYPEVNRSAIKEMQRQVGDLELDDYGVATAGVLIRHLVLPHGLAGTADVCSFIGREVSLNTYINVMAQYRPCYKAFDVPELARPLSTGEYSDAVRIAQESGLHRLDRIEARSSARIIRMP
jgi:putative pyruvate formate lyase activating enzyme